MPKSMTAEVANLIVQALERGLSRSQIAGVVGVSRRAITRISTNLRTHGQPKAPPSGLKQGRPIKMSEAQANAMLGWMAGRNYTFYVKDLTQFLKDNHGFKGCDGTVRRALIRAGFKRKLPWHKSEITAWIPPDGPPDLSFVMHPKPPTRNKKPRMTAAALSRTNAADTIDVEMADEQDEALSEQQKIELQTQAKVLARMPTETQQRQPGAQHPGIDPALETAPDAAVTAPINGQLAQHESVAPVVPSMGAPVTSPTPTSAAASPYSQPLQQSSQRMSVLTPNTQLNPQHTPRSQFSTLSKIESRILNRAQPRPRVSKALAPRPPQQQASMIDPNLVTTLQSEVARQQELIAHLQRQLAQGYPAALTTPSESALMTTAAAPNPATANAATHVSNTVQMPQEQQQEQQEAREQVRHDEDEDDADDVDMEEEEEEEDDEEEEEEEEGSGSPTKLTTEQTDQLQALRELIASAGSVKSPRARGIARLAGKKAPEPASRPGETDKQSKPSNAKAKAKAKDTATSRSSTRPNNKKSTRDGKKQNGKERDNEHETGEGEAEKEIEVEPTTEHDEERQRQKETQLDRGKEREQEMGQEREIHHRRQQQTEPGTEHSKEKDKDNDAAMDTTDGTQDLAGEAAEDDDEYDDDDVV